MKHSWKIWFLILPALVLLLLVMSTDIAFYRIPSIISLFRFEREIAIWLLFLSLLPVIRYIFSRFCWTPQRGLILHAALMVGLELVLILPQVCLKKYLNLWDDNPFLAEFPFIWVTISALIAVLFVVTILADLLNLRKLTAFRRKGNSDFVHFLLIGSFLVAAVVFNLTEDRHSYQSMTILNDKLKPLLWPITGLYGAVFFLNVFNMQWLTTFGRRVKIIASLIGLPIIGSGILVYFSRLLTPVYAYSVSVKGFALATLTFLLFFSIATEIVLLLSLPGARRYDRLARQMASISEMGRMVQAGCDLSKVAGYILKCSMNITGSEYGWIEMTGPEIDQSKFIAIQGIPDSVGFADKNKNQLSLCEFLKPPNNSLIINDVYKDSRTLKMRLIPARWHSLIVTAIMNGTDRIGIIYLAKDTSFGFNAEDEQILEPLIVQAGINLTIVTNGSRLYWPDSGINETGLS